jgi:hypothetical protein
MIALLTISCRSRIVEVDKLHVLSVISTSTQDYSGHSDHNLNIKPPHMAEPLRPPFYLDHAILPDQDPNLSPNLGYVNSTILINEEGVLIESKDAIQPSLLADFDLSRLNNIHDLLWWAGRQRPARPLHRHIMLGRQILITEQLDMHLLRTRSKIFLKPIPSLLLNFNQWQLHISNCNELHENACGLLLSYIWLIRHQSDLQIAKEAGLIPDTIMMESWHQFVTSFLVHVDANTFQQVNKRFEYGELRFNRVSQIYRFAPRFHFKHLIFGYGLYPATYGTFFRRNFGWLLGVFAYISTLLAAMQVGLAAISVPTERVHSIFNVTAYKFALIITIAPAIIGLITVLLYAALFLFHLLSAFKSNTARRINVEKVKIENGV